MAYWAGPAPRGRIRRLPSVTPRPPRTLIVALLLAATALVAWVVVAQSRNTPAATPADGTPVANPAPPAVPVVMGQATEGSGSVVLDIVGSGLAARSVTLFPAAAGEVVAVGFRAGQRVRARDVLLRLDDRQQRLAVDLAAARLDAARRLLARYEATRGTGAVPGSVIDEAESGVRLAEIALRQAREALADRVLRAPFDGTIGLAQVEPGDRVALDTAIATLDDRRTLQVAFDVPELHAARLTVGQPLSVTNPAFGDRRFAGQVAQIDSRVDAVSRSLRLRATVPNPEDLLRPGMSFQVRLELPGATHVSVPELALQWGREGAFVWVVRDGRAQSVPVRSLRRGGGRVLLDGAVRAGDTVVVEGVQRLRDGRSVAPLAGDAPGAAASRAPASAAR
jgi:membrane fusion protein (multidrug efflux system)